VIRPPPPVRPKFSTRRPPRRGPDPRVEALEVRDSGSSVAGAMFAATVEAHGPLPCRTDSRRRRSGRTSRRQLKLRGSVHDPVNPVGRLRFNVLATVSGHRTVVSANLVAVTSYGDGIRVEPDADAVTLIANVAGRDHDLVLVGDVDDDPRRAGEPEDSKARLATQAQAEGDEALKVAGVLDLAQVGAARREDARQEAGPATCVKIGR
jgi:hypothetical protein